MVMRCLAVLLMLSSGLFGLLAATGEGPAVAVKDRQTIVLGATGELPAGAVPGRSRLALVTR